jgi:2-methylcitrate dehydratase
VGHRSRRAEGLPLLKAKFEQNIATRLSPRQCSALIELFADQERLETFPVNEFMDLLAAEAQ